MDHLETPYDTEVQFIDCTVCDKSIRGENLYKIHLTTAGHLQREEFLISQGLDIKPQNLPKFRNFLHYLDYLNLDEPIIGLSFVEELASSEINEQYTCKLCSCLSSLTEMIYHIIGRKHRLRYLNTKRPDLVTWDRLGTGTQAGKLIRAKAEVIERQDGRGTPLLLNAGNQSKFNNSKGPQRQNQNWGQTIPQNQKPAGKVPPLLPEFESYKSKFSNQRRYPEDQPHKAAFQADNPDTSRDRWRPRDDALDYSRMDDRPQTAKYMESGMYRDSMSSDSYNNQQEDQYGNDPGRSNVFEQGDVARFDYREETSYGQAQQGDGYPQDQRSYDMSHQERDAPNDFYSERGREQLSSDYTPAQQAYRTDGEQRWSREREPDRLDSMYREERQDEPEAKRRSFLPLVDSEQTHDHVFRIVRDYQHERRTPLGGETSDYAEPGRADVSGRQVEVTRNISDIPEPFRRFLTGDNDADRHGKRKRKSRFSDATPEEVERTKEIYNFIKHNNPNIGGDHGMASRSVDGGTHYSNFSRESQNPHYTEGFQRGGSHSDGVFDMLKNVEIENAEEADFLKNKLCSLLKEFKSKKLEKDSQDSYSRVGMSRNYSDSKPEPQLPRYPLYEGPLSEEPKQHFSDNDHRRELTLEHQHQDKPRQSSRSRYEGMFGKAHASHLDEPPYYPERFQEPPRSHDYQPAAEEFYDSPLPVGQGARTQREQRYSNTLDKITSTLLELVSRK